MFHDHYGRPFPTNFEEEWKVDKMLGEGSFAKVYLCIRRVNGQEAVAKVINKLKVKESHLIAEIDILLSIQHPFISQVIAIYETEEEVCLILEYLRGGDLFERVYKYGAYPEIEAKYVMKYLLMALGYLDQKGIIHRDLKTENLVLVSPHSTTQVKLIDFGLACRLTCKRIKTRCGSPGYVAPEILAGQTYNTKADVFSAGVILYILLVGFPPFRGQTEQEVLKKNLKGIIEFRPKDRWKDVSPSAMNLLQWLCGPDASRRPSAANALNHPWLKETIPMSPSLSETPEWTGSQSTYEESQAASMSTAREELKNWSQATSETTAYTTSAPSHNHKLVASIDSPPEAPSVPPTPVPPVQPKTVSHVHKQPPQPIKDPQQIGSIASGGERNSPNRHPIGVPISSTISSTISPTLSAKTSQPQGLPQSAEHAVVPLNGITSPVMPAQHAATNSGGLAASAPRSQNQVVTNPVASTNSPPRTSLSTTSPPRASPARTSPPR
eukprot:Platyproteum_vivax@DN16122_c0_g1_i1.p1